MTPDKPIPWDARFALVRAAALLAAFLIFLLAVQLLYFIPLYLRAATRPAGNFDLVLTYSDSGSLEPALALARAGHTPLFVSQASWERYPFPRESRNDRTKVNMDLTSSTTDQNARRAAAFIEQGQYKTVVLDVGWFHVPRALFLTRLYLMGTGVEVVPCAKTPLPPRWWLRPVFYGELFKFWGSLGRVGLDFLGWETGPKGPRHSRGG